MGWKCLTKEGLRDRRVQILGAQYGDTQWDCGCETVDPRKQTRPRDRRLHPAGQRWSKNHVPTPSHPKTVNPAPVAQVEDPFDPWKEAVEG
jgi:hypothetical protein